MQRDQDYGKCMCIEIGEKMYGNQESGMLKGLYVKLCKKHKNK